MNRVVELWGARAALVAALGAGAVIACRSGTSVDGAAPGNDGGASSGDATASSSGGSSSGLPAAGCLADPSPCGTTTPTLHPSAAGTLYCGGTGATTLSCAIGQQCCLGGALGDGGFAPEQCAARGQPCANGGGGGTGTPGLPIACYSSGDCAANGASGDVCCLKGASPTSPACAWPRYANGQGIACETACGADEVRVCTSNDDCPSGTTCVPGKWKIFQVGFCLAGISCEASSTSSSSSSSSGASGGGCGTNDGFDVVPCAGGGYCPAHSTCQPPSGCNCNAGYRAVDCAGKACAGACNAPSWQCAPQTSGSSGSTSSSGSTCGREGAGCSSDSNCCSGLRCDEGDFSCSSTCRQSGDGCIVNSDCCSYDCQFDGTCG